MFTSSVSGLRKRCNLSDDIIKRIHLRNWVLLAILASCSLVFMQPSFTLGVFAGGLITNLGFHFLQKILLRSLDPSKEISGKVVFVKYYLRLIAMGSVIFWLISRHFVDAIGLLVGLSIVVINLTLIGFGELAKILIKEGV